MIKKTDKGFTLMEMLIVVAIIAILISIAIPTFSNLLEKARDVRDISNLRSAASEVMAEAVLDTLEHKNGTAASKAANGVYFDRHSSDGSEYYKKLVLACQKKGGWQNLKNPSDRYSIGDYPVASSIYGWSVWYCIKGENEGKLLIYGISEESYKKYKAQGY